MDRDDRIFLDAGLGGYLFGNRKIGRHLISHTTLFEISRSRLIRNLFFIDFLDNLIGQLFPVATIAIILAPAPLGGGGVGLVGLSQLIFAGLIPAFIAAIGVTCIAWPTYDVRVFTPSARTKISDYIHQKSPALDNPDGNG
jgi:hypothetical protein